MRILYVMLWAAIISANVYASEVNHDAYDNKEIGIYIEKPSDWFFISKQTAIDNRTKVRLKDEEFQRKYFNTARAPLVVINKYEDPASREGVSPTVQVLMTPAPNPNMTPEQVLDMSIRAFKNNALTFKYIEKITPINLSDHNGAKAVFVYTLGTNMGFNISVKTRVYVAKRDNYFFTVSMAGPDAGNDISDNQFQMIINSLKIEK